MEVVKGLHNLEVKLDALKGALNEASLNRIAWACGFVIESHVKQNIEREPSSVAGVPKIGLIDTGFMVNATYTIGPDQNGARGARQAADAAFRAHPPSVSSVKRLGAENEARRVRREDPKQARWSSTKGGNVNLTETDPGNAPLSQGPLRLRRFVEVPPPVPSPGTGESIVTNGAEYFIWVHQGHHNVPSHPVMRRAAVENDAEVVKTAKDLVLREIRGVL